MASNPIKCLILEDELPAQKLLLNYITRTTGLTCLGVYGAVSQVPLPILAQTEVLFLDIQLPEINGLQFLNSLTHKPTVVITSAYREYALDAFEEAVTDYLLKPFSYQRFLKAIFRVQEMRAQPPQASPTEGPLFVYTDKAFIKLEKSNIKYLSAEADYVRIVPVNGKPLLLNDSLNNWAEKLGADGFVRVHRSYLVNYRYIDQVEGNMVRMGHETLPIGKTYRQAFLELLKRN